MGKRGCELPVDAEETERLAQDGEVRERFATMLRIVTIVLAGGQMLLTGVFVASAISGGSDKAGNAMMAGFATLAVVLVLLTCLPALIMALTKTAPKTAFVLSVIIPGLWLVTGGF